jgi:alanyl-tRNA synthetase
VGAKELGKIEAIVRQQIVDALPVFARDAPLAEARKIVGLRAVFGEVSRGNRLCSNEPAMPSGAAKISMSACTHVLV